MSIAEATRLGLAFCACPHPVCNCGTLRTPWAPVCPDCLADEHVFIPQEVC